MKLSDLATETLAKIKSVRWERIIEKQGSENRDSVLRYYEPELMIEGRVLLPVERSHHPNITRLRCI